MNSKMILIEFSNGKPFAAVRKNENGYDEYFDIEWCKRDGCYYAENSGNGFYLESADNKFWLAPGYPLPPVNSSTPTSPDNRLTRRPRGFGGDLWDWASEEECQYCDICQDWFPCDDLCSHIWWDDEAGWWSVPGDRKEIVGAGQ